MTTTLEVNTDEKIAVTDDGDHDRFQHYFHKAAINENLMSGKPMKALCGAVVKQQVDPQGRTICGTCKDILDEVFGKEE
jgi:PhoPQ-activated pathogenicity-related protein